ncbi:hypothetical protein SK128_013638, partial [Halocaridina rubra]
MDQNFFGENHCNPILTRASAIRLLNAIANSTHNFETEIGQIYERTNACRTSAANRLVRLLVQLNRLYTT